MKDVIYIEPNTQDHNPEIRTWYYDDFGNRVDKKTGNYVIFVNRFTTKKKQELLTETDYDTKPCDSE